MSAANIAINARSLNELGYSPRRAQESAAAEIVMGAGCTSEERADFVLRVARGAGVFTRDIERAIAKWRRED